MITIALILTLLFTLVLFFGLVVVGLLVDEVYTN